MKLKIGYVSATIVIVCFLAFLLYLIRTPMRYVPLKNEHLLLQTQIERPPARGFIYLNDSLVLNGGILLVENQSNIDARDGTQPIRSFVPAEERSKIVPLLGDLAPPYQIYKKKNNDTLVVIKNGTDTLKYLLNYTLDDLYPPDTVTVNDLLRSIFTPKSDNRK